MSLIVCPECGGSVSDTARQCVHCGYELNFCPECGGQISDTMVQCIHCGYVLKKDANIAGEAKDKSDTNGVTEIVSQWRSQTNIKKYETIHSYLLLFSLLFLGIALIVTRLWQPDNNTLDELLDCFYSYKNTETVVSFCLTGAVICIVASVVFAIIIGKSKKNFLSWCQEKKIDVKEAIMYDYISNKESVGDKKQIEKRKRRMKEIIDTIKEPKSFFGEMIGPIFAAGIFGFLAYKVYEFTLVKIRNFLSLYNSIDGENYVGSNLDSIASWSAFLPFGFLVCLIIALFFKGRNDVDRVTPETEATIEMFAEKEFPEIYVKYNTEEIE